LIAAFMLLAGSLSAFMNNVGVTALLLPVVVGVARQSQLAPSRLLMPMTFGCLLGGAVTLIGTPPNLLVNAALVDAGYAGFGFFDFAPVGIPVLLAGTLFVALVGRHLLPDRDPISQAARSRDLRQLYSLEERIFALRVTAKTEFVGKRIADTGLTSTAGLMIIALTRAGQTRALPSATTRLQAGDVLLAQGRLDRFNLLRHWSELSIAREAPILHEKLLEGAALYEVVVGEKSDAIGQRVVPARFFERYGGWLLAIRHGEEVRRTHLREREIVAGDHLLIQADDRAMERLRDRYPNLRARTLNKQQVQESYQLEERLLVLKVPRDAALAGRTVGESRLGKDFDFRLLALFRDGEFLRPLASDQLIEGADLLLVQGREEDFDMLRGLQKLEILDDATPYLRVFEQGKVEMVEATIHPHTPLNGKTVGDLKLRETYQVDVAAVWREGRPHRSGLGSMELQRGDALLLVGPLKQLARLNDNPDLIILNPVSVRDTDTRKAPLAGGLMAGVVLATLTGWLPIHIAAILGAALMVLTQCLSMEDAYKAIHWRSVFVVAGMMPLGVAMQVSGTAAWLAETLLALTGGYSPWVTVAGLFGLTVAATIIIPTVVLVVLMAPIALSVSLTLDIAPHAPLMAVALAAAASVASPVSHPSNVLVMGPGAYRFTDFLKLGLPLTLVIFLVAAAVMPRVWPL
ncbi:MAG: SLC13 family permease, partial [Pseudomonadota bacterium]